MRPFISARTLTEETTERTPLLDTRLSIEPLAMVAYS
jgi:hypothetical protein